LKKEIFLGFKKSLTRSRGCLLVKIIYHVSSFLLPDVTDAEMFSLTSYLITFANLLTTSPQDTDENESAKVEVFF
jgi:hypothetical protein